MSRVMEAFQRERTRWGSIAVLAMLCLRLVGCSGGDGPVVEQSTPNGAISGQVVTGVSNTPVAGATVRSSAGTTTTGSDGKFNVPAPAGDRTVVQIEADGFAAAFPVTRVRTGQTTSLGVKLLPVGVMQTVSVSTGGTVSVPNSTARVDLPADGLVPQNGGTAAGTVTVSVTPINPATDPSLMPGDFTGVTAGGGSNTPIESFGALGVDIQDTAGTRYTLASGKTATIRIPLGTLSPNPPTTIPLWYFNETTGVWQEEGTATLRGTGANRYYEGPVVRFTRYWNADKATEVIFVSGCVTDPNGQPVPNMLVATTGLDYSGTASTVTKQDGTFRVAMRKDGKAKVNGVEISPQTFASRNATNVMTVGPSSSDIALADCLVLNPDVVVITTNSPLPDGRVGDAYNQTLSAIGGTPGYVWSLNAGSAPLPAGLSLNPTGVISGTPTSEGTATLIVKVTDSAGGTATKPLSLRISGVNPPIAITTASPLLSGIVGSPYSVTLAASGGTGAHSWTVAGGTLPTGLTLDPSTGVISGLATTAGTSNVTIRVQDSGSPQRSAQKVFALTINQTPPTINIVTTSPLPNGVVGAAYTQTISATGGTGARKWTVSSGILPGGLTLGESTGVISGTPNAAGTATVTIRVEDSAVPPQADQQVFSFTITQIPPPPATLKILTPSPLPASAVGVPYSLPITATGGTGARTWSVSVGTLPAGLTLETNTGVISGTPTSEGTSTFSISVKDSAVPPQSDQKAFSLTVQRPCSNCPPGELSVSNAPASVGGTFNGTIYAQSSGGASGVVGWREISSNGTHVEIFVWGEYNLPGLTYQLIFGNAGVGGGTAWTCVFPTQEGVTTCSGVTRNPATGTLTLTNTVLSTVAGETPAPPITLNGTLRFTPF